MIRPHNFDTRRGWENTCPNWYTHILQYDIITSVSLDKFDDLYFDILEWLYTKIDLCERHARWLRTNNQILVKFRYERDYLLFMLRWS
jgi:hypothetical protein